MEGKEGISSICYKWAWLGDIKKAVGMYPKFNNGIWRSVNRRVLPRCSFLPSIIFSLKNGPIVSLLCLFPFILSVSLQKKVYQC